MKYAIEMVRLLSLVEYFANLRVWPVSPADNFATQMLLALAKH